MTTQTKPLSSMIDKALFAVTGGFIALFCAYALFDIEGLSALVDASFGFSARYFGLYWQVLLLATFLIGLLLCVLPGSKTVMGGLATPEFKMFSWGAMIMCTLLAGGGVFWAAGEPIAHFLSTPHGVIAAAALQWRTRSCYTGLMETSREENDHDVLCRIRRITQRSFDLCYR